MPVGVCFENSCLKNSFSLSSLQQPSDQTPDKEKAVKPRQFNSLTKQRVKATAVRRSWSSTASDHREEFWSVLQANYNYIMDNQLIDNCQEIDGDLKSQNGTWSLKEFFAQFSELYSWLNSVQETIYGKEENITDKALRARCLNTVLEKSSSLKQFNEQASQLVQAWPEAQEEVGWRTTHLNSKWDSILSLLGPSECDHCDQDTCIDIDHELKCLRKWFKMMESCLQPLDFRAKYTKTEIETKALDLNVLHRDIKNHGKIVGSVVKLCKRQEGAGCGTNGGGDVVNARRIANGLERRWHLLFLRSLEWQCYLESLSKRQNARNSASSSDESDSDCYKEPASKYPRLSEKENRNKNFDDYSSSEDEYSSGSNEGVMSDNRQTRVDETTDRVDLVDGSVGEDTSQFTRSNKKAPNLATYYFKHEDTDSEMDKDRLGCVKTDGQSTLGETSEEEWTYTKTNDDTLVAMELDEQNRIEECDEVAKAKPKLVPEDTIRRLVQKAEELVSPDKCRRNSLKKMSRINKWLTMERPDDSCDASGEDDEKESQTSEEIDASTMTLREAQSCNSQNTSYMELNGNRMSWCGSCSISQLNQATSSSVMNNFSISESALHKMALTPKVLDRFTTVSSNNFNGHQSTSSTVEEVSPMVMEKASPTRRKKYKIKKKALFGKSDTHLLYSPNAHKQRNLLIKSGSFSGYSTTTANNNERHTSSDPSAVNICPLIGWCETSTTSGADSEDESKRMPNFKPGLRTRYLQGPELRDDSPGKSSLNTTEEQSSSLSEQAWDNYQENYLSEPYSESHDSDAVRRLVNFGEDYRNYIDSQSDWSAFSDMSPKFKRKTWVHHQVAEESNSDEESLKQLINDSRDQLKYAEDIYDQVKEGINSKLVTSEIEELVSSCDRHIALLNHISESSEEYKMSTGDKAVTTGLLSQWRGLKIRSMKMQDYRKLQKEISELKNFVTSLDVPDKRKLYLQNFPSEDIQNEIDACKRILDAIKNQSSKLASLNAMVHRFTLENQDFDDFSKCTLKSDISELYELFDNARVCANRKLDETENLLPAWKTLETRLDQLHKDLQDDEKTIHLLDSVLSSGQFSDQTASSVRDVAKLLSETATCQGYPLNELFTGEGSFSDSGISDEGSEHEPGERQGRLAAIRRLVRQLEAGLAPESCARRRMRDKLVVAEEELRALQLRCRELIVRTATATATTPERIFSGVALAAKEAQAKASTKQKVLATPEDDGGDPDGAPAPPSWFRRMFRASLAFQLVILTFVCLSCLFEPQCCDYMNNYSWTFSPKLHYEGRPPI